MRRTQQEETPKPVDPTIFSDKDKQVVKLFAKDNYVFLYKIGEETHLVLNYQPIDFADIVVKIIAKHPANFIKYVYEPMNSTNVQSLNRNYILKASHIDYYCPCIDICKCSSPRYNHGHVCARADRDCKQSSNLGCYCGARPHISRNGKPYFNEAIFANLGPKLTFDTEFITWDSVDYERYYEAKYGTKYATCKFRISLPGIIKKSNQGIPLIRKILGEMKLKTSSIRNNYELMTSFIYEFESYNTLSEDVREIMQILPEHCKLEVKKV